MSAWITDRFVIVSQKLASDYFPHEDPIGKHLHVTWRSEDGEDYEIVGVVGDTLYTVKAELRPMIYFPMLSGIPSMTSDAMLVLALQPGCSAARHPDSKADRAARSRSACNESANDGADRW